MRLLILALSLHSATLLAVRDERPEVLRSYGKAGGTVVVALSASCPCSKSHEPVVAALARRFPEFGFVGIRADDLETSRHFAEAKLPFPVVATKGAASALGAMKTPHVFVYDGSGRLRYQGGVDDSHDAARATKPYLADALSALREGKSPTLERTRPLGCRVDWE